MEPRRDRRIEVLTALYHRSLLARLWVFVCWMGLYSVVAYLALKRAGVSAELHVYADTAHDFAVRKVDKPCDGWTRSCADWMRQQGFLKAKK